MSFRNHVVVPVILAALATLAACGGGGSPSPIIPPSGGFSTSSLNGTYVFSTAGADVNGYYFAMAGTLTADGSGNITSGTIDINDSDIQLSPFVQAFGQAISSGSTYSVTADGRGKITLVNTAIGTVGFDFVLTSSSGGMITEFDGNGSGSGTFELQSSAVTQAQLAQGYAFSFSGFDSVPNTMSAAGAFTLGSDGTVVSGVHDFNDSQIVYANQALTGSVVLASSGTSGTAQFTTALGLLNFDFYVIDATHLKFIETDALPYVVLSGDVFQQASMPTGNLVFVMGGGSSSVGPLTFGGSMTASGAGQTGSGLEDANIGGTLSSAQVPFTLTYVAPVTGRSVMTLTGFSGGPTSLAVFPSSGGLLMLEIDSNAMSSGTAYVQSATSLATAPQGYGLSFSGVNSNGELDDIAQFVTASTGSMTGILDENDQGSTISPQSITSTSAYVLDSPATGRGEAQFNSSSSTTLFDIVFYTIDGSNSVFMETDSSQLALGAFQQQTTPAARAAAGKTAGHPLTFRPLVMSRGTLRHLKATSVKK